MFKTKRTKIIAGLLLIGVGLFVFFKYTSVGKRLFARASTPNFDPQEPSDFINQVVDNGGEEVDLQEVNDPSLYDNGAPVR